MNVIVVSDHRKYASRIERLFETPSATVVWEPNLDRVLARSETNTFDVLLVTSVALKAGDLDGMEVLEIISAKSPITQVLFLAEPRDIEAAMSAIRAGSYQYAMLPIGDRELRLLIETAVHQRPELASNQLLRSEGSTSRDVGIVGRSPAMREVYRQLQQAAAADIPVLLVGETGTGKDLVAQAIHARSRRQKGPFIPVSLASLPVELMGSELFGHEKGAFTGAVDHRDGKSEQAAGGSVFLDEIGAVDEKTQVSLLRLIEQKKFHRLGGRRLISTDVRVIAATNDDLTALVSDGRFREDLFFRLDVFRIALPPLRVRQGDIPLLADAFLRRYSDSFGKKIAGVEPECISLLETYQWPGNVRELKNVVQRAVLVCEEIMVAVEHLPPRFRKTSRRRSSVTIEIGTPLQEVEREMITQVLEVTENNRTRAAQVLGISRRSLYYKLRKHGIE